MKNYILPICLILSVGFMACEEEFLDRKMDTNYTEEQVFSSYTPMRDFGVGIYSYLPQGFDRIDGAMLASATDDAVHSGTGTDIISLTNGSWGPFNNPDDHWAHFYAGIRKANVFLEKTEDYKNIVYRDTITDAGKNAYENHVDDIRWMRAEARFLRAYFYFELNKRYGGVPIIKETLSPYEDNLRLTRKTYEENVDFILDDIATAVEDLKDTWVGFNENNESIGRATKGAALALKSRVLLYAASPLHNIGNDVEKWKAAAEAAHDVIELNQYSLADNYRNLFRTTHNNEFIFERRYSASNTLERANYPVGFEGAVGGTNPSQNLVNAYETINGLSINDDPEYDPQDPYADRDPRLGMTIIVNDSDYKGRKVEVWQGGQDGPNKPRGTRTGYYLKKYADESLDLLQNTTSAHTWVYFRYAEILLNYAEAMNEAYGPDDNAGYSLTAREALNMVRQRPGVNMPAVTTASQDEFREKVKNERRIELAFEEHRFWDVRRWLEGTEVFDQPIYGVKVVRNTDGSYTYTYPTVAVENRIFENHMTLYPIPQDEINKTAGSLTQNSNW